MNKLTYSSLSICLLLALVVTGCTIRTYTVTKDRVDQQIQGNRGYLSGDAPKIEGEPRSKTRKTAVMEIEFGVPWAKKPVATEKQEEREIVTEPVEVYEEDILAEEAEIMPEEKEITYTMYKIQKDDTLQKISKKFYGTYRKWKMIYDANTDVLKNPHRIKPGITIRVPEE